MADDVRGTQKVYPTHIEGQFAAVCADIVDLGQRLTQFPGQPSYPSDKFAIVFLTDSEGEVKDVSVEFTNSLSMKGKMLPFVIAWRGRSYSPDELKEGIEFKNMVGKSALLTVEHKTSKTGRTYSVISGITRLPKAMPAPSIEGYVRAPFWAEKKKAYADELRTWADAQLKTRTPAGADYPNQGPEDDDPDEMGF